jgi:hypothetical protein
MIQMKEFTVYVNPNGEEMLLEEELESYVRNKVEYDDEDFSDWLLQSHSAFELLLMSPEEAEEILTGYVEEQIAVIKDEWTSRTFIIETP